MSVSHAWNWKLRDLSGRGIVYSDVGHTVEVPGFAFDGLGFGSEDLWRALQICTAEILRLATENEALKVKPGGSR